MLAINHRANSNASHFRSSKYQTKFFFSLSVDSGETLHGHKISIYKEASEKIAQITRRGDLLIFKILVPIYVIPTILQSYWQYYYLTMGIDAFRLPMRAS